MAAHRYWRLVGFATYGGGALELSEARLYAAGSIADGSSTVSCSATPLSGSLTDLRDGSAVSVVVWSATAYSVSGFALVWDLGVAGAAEVDCLQLGSGSTAKTFPKDLVVQWSDDGSLWSTLRQIPSVAYPGANSLTALYSGDIHFEKVALLLHFDGANDSSVFIDSSPRAKAVTPVGSAKLSTTTKVYGSASGVFSGSNSCLSIPYHADFNISPYDFCIEFLLYIAAPSALDGNSTRVAQIVSANIPPGGGLTKNSWGVILNGNSSKTGTGLIFSLNDASGNAYFLSADYSFSALTWYRCKICRVSAVGIDVYVDDVKLTKQIDTIGLLSYPLGATNPVLVGRNGYPGYVRELNGCLDELRISSATARAGAATQTAAWPDDDGFLQVSPFTPSVGLGGWRPHQIIGSPRPAGAASTVIRTRVFADVYNGGWGVVSGTVKQKSTPVNTPLRRRVVLIDEQSRATIRETWSDAVTGNYEFRGVKLGVPYTVLSYDHTHGYRATVADNLLAEVMA